MTGIGWRNIIEHMHQNATIANGMKSMAVMRFCRRQGQLSDPTHNLKLNEIDLMRPNKPDMNGPKAAHEEKVMMRIVSSVLKQQELSRTMATSSSDKGYSLQKDVGCGSLVAGHRITPRMFSDIRGVLLWLLDQSARSRVKLSSFKRDFCISNWRHRWQ